jgi:hypothetical protein
MLKLKLNTTIIIKVTKQGITRYSSLFFVGKVSEINQSSVSQIDTCFNFQTFYGMNDAMILVMQEL